MIGKIFNGKGKPMKNKFMSIFILLTVVLFAFDAYGYEISDEHITITPDCTGGSRSVIESVDLSSILILKSLHPELKLPFDKEFLDLASIYDCYASAGAEVYSTDGYVNSNIMLSSYHAILSE
jgi:hypothetical protein